MLSAGLALLRGARPTVSGAAAALALAIIGAMIGSAARAEPIRGAGSTLAAPIIGKWATTYKAARADGGDFFTLDWTVDYEPVGSLAGLMRLAQPELDFAATDVPVQADDLARNGQQQFPIVMGGIAVVANLDGLPEQGLRLSGPVIADIYLGKIKSWSDPAIRVLNPNIALPDLAISVIHRQDGSGSTYVFTEFLSSTSEDWKTKPGADTLIDWPLGTGAEGTQALLRAVAASKGAIAYAEYGQVLRAGLPFAAVQNKSGKFVKPDPQGVQAAATSVALGGKRPTSSPPSPIAAEMVRTRSARRCSPLSRSRGVRNIAIAACMIFSGSPSRKVPATPPHSAMCRCRKRSLARSNSIGQGNCRSETDPNESCLAQQLNFIPRRRGDLLGTA